MTLNKLSASNVPAQDLWGWLVVVITQLLELWPPHALQVRSVHWKDDSCPLPEARGDMDDPSKSNSDPHGILLMD